jgi:hypothetical protein
MDLSSPDFHLFIEQAHFCLNKINFRNHRKVFDFSKKLLVYHLKIKK